MQARENAETRLTFHVPKLCFGPSARVGRSVTGLPDADEEQALATIRSIFDLGPCFIDTSRNYGKGSSEERLGTVIRELGGLPGDCVLATKLDRDPLTDRLDAERARRSLEESLEALGLDRLQILHLHDPEHCADVTDITRSGGALDELFRMKEEGLVDAVGLAMGDLPLMMQILPDWEFDAIINHNRFTLLNRSADALFDAAFARGIAIFNAAPYASGILAMGTKLSRVITYREVTDNGQLEPVRAIEAACSRHDVPTGAAALQFSLRDHRITSTIVGVASPENVGDTVHWADRPIPRSLWEELERLPFSTGDPEEGRVIG